MGTEGDAFIIAFHSPQDAVRFATQVQLALLEAGEWPNELLAEPGCEPVWAGSRVNTDNILLVTPAQPR